MALTDIELVSLAIGNTEANPYYPILTEDEVEAILLSENGDVNKAIRRAARTASFIVISIPNREKIGDIEMWNEYSRNYLAALNNILSDDSYSLPTGMMPYAGGIKKDDYCKTENNPNRKTSKLTSTVNNTRVPDSWREWYV